MKFRNKIKTVTNFILILFVGVYALQSCKQENKAEDKVENKTESIIKIDSTEIPQFFETYPELEKYEEDYQNIYKHYDFQAIWFDAKGMKNYTKSLYERVADLEEEGIYATFPYQEKVKEIYEENIKNPEDDIEAELLMNGLYVFYLEHVYKGINDQTSKDLGWLLPRKHFEDTALLDSVISEKKWEENDSLMVEQYYRMRDKLKHFRKIHEQGGWKKIELSADQKKFKPEDSSAVIRQIRDRLYISGEIENNNESEIYDEELKEGIIKFQKHHGFNEDAVISAEHITALNIPVEDYIEKIVVNLERLRWIPTEINKVKEFIFVNIPAYHLDYYRDGEIIFDSDVVVGKIMTETVIFDGEMSYLAFSPYWNIPKSIIEKEIKPGMEKDENYLEKRNMEWNNGNVRQKPGKNNSLGLVKFMFPNENNIYLHDTPAKYLFQNEDRALSHGCIRVEKAKDLAETILENDDKWNAEKIDEAMHKGKESTYELKNKIPVYIGYFTAWIDENDEMYFYKDIYKRDKKLADLLLFEK